MQKNVTWFFLFLKNQFRQWETWVVCGCMIVSLVFINLIRNPAVDNLSIGFYVCQEDELSLRMKTMLLSVDSIFEFYETDSRKRLEEDIRAGNVFCGFVIEDEFKEKVENGEQKDCITYICLQETARGRVAKETVYAEFFKLLSEQLIKKYGAEIVGKDSEELLDASLENSRLYLEGDELFYVDYLQMDGGRKQDGENTNVKQVYPTEGLFISFLFLGILLVNVENRSENRKNLLLLMNPMDRIRLRLGQYLALGCVIGILGECCLIILNQGTNWKAQLIGFLGAVLLSIVWSIFADRLFSKEITYHVWMVTILLFHILISPVFFRIGDYLPALQWIQWTSPVGFYLHIVEGFMA